MPLVEFQWDWKLVLALFILVLFITVVSFEMIAEWDKKKRSDLKLLLLGVGLYGLVLVGISSSIQVTLLASMIILPLLLLGLLAAENDFDTSKKPWELYFIAISSLLLLGGTVTWAMYKTEAGKYIRSKAGDFKESIKQRRQALRQKKMDQQQMRDRNVLLVDNPTFEIPDDF